MESPVSREQLGVVADDRSLAREGGYQSTTVVAAEDQLQTAPEPSSDVGLGTAIGGVALVEDSQRGKVRRTLRLVSVQSFEHAVTGVAFGVHTRHNTGERLDSPGWTDQFLSSSWRQSRWCARRRIRAQRLAYRSVVVLVEPPVRTVHVTVGPGELTCPVRRHDVDRDLCHRLVAFGRVSSWRRGR